VKVFNYGKMLSTKVPSMVNVLKSLALVGAVGLVWVLQSEKLITAPSPPKVITISNTGTP
jgi:hypothetical protein